jgi:two-component system OmpR family sensor kinase
MTSTAGRSLGTRLAASTALIAAMAIGVFAIVAAAILWRHESSEVQPGSDGADAESEVLEQMALALVVTTPLVVGLGALAARRVTRRLTAHVDDLVANAARGLDAQRRFVADASHELRTPLSVLRTELEVARRRPRDAAAWEELADRAIAEVTRMSEMVEALLRLARTAATPARRDVIDVPALVDNVVASQRAQAAARDVRIEPRVDAVTCTGDAEALAVALGNLVANAIAHSPPAGTVALRVQARGTNVVLTVDDEGPGVPPDERERIFVPFARGRLAADRAGTTGVGLGLSVARRIVEAHAGALSVTDAPRRGARFEMSIPADPM